MSIAGVKLLGVLDLSETQRRHLRSAYVLTKANGYVNATGRANQAFKSAMRRLARMTLAIERPNWPGVFDLTATGKEIGALLGPRKGGAA